MPAIVVESEADHDGVHTEHPLEVADDWDRAAFADRERLLAPFLRERGARLRERGIVVGQLDRRRAAEIPECDLTVDRQFRLHIGAKAVADFLRILRADQAE